MFGEKSISNQAHHFIFWSNAGTKFLTYLKDNVLIVTYLKDNDLIVTPGDRADIIISSLQANISVNFPKVAGIVLTGGLEPGESLIRLIEGLQDVVPIISVNPGSFSTATQIGAIQSRITMDNTRKLEWPLILSKNRWMYNHWMRR